MGLALAARTFIFWTVSCAAPRWLPASAAKVWTSFLPPPGSFFMAAASPATALSLALPAADSS